MAYPVQVVGIFTNGVRSSSTFGERRTRFLVDIARANEAWGTGFFPGVSCGINFVPIGQFNRPNVSIPAHTVSNINDPQVENLIQQTKIQSNNATAVYVVYLSGDTLANGIVIRIRNKAFHKG